MSGICGEKQRSEREGWKLPIKSRGQIPPLGLWVWDVKGSYFNGTQSKS